MPSLPVSVCVCVCVLSDVYLSFSDPQIADPLEHRLLPQSFSEDCFEEKTISESVTERRDTVAWLTLCLCLSLFVLWLGVVYVVQVSCR